VEYLLSDVQPLQLPDESVDAVFANMLLHHCPDPLAAILKMARILKPGGRLVITDVDTHAHEWMKAEMADVWLGFERGQDISKFV
jgi:arsenite methyltransferase